MTQIVFSLWRPICRGKVGLELGDILTFATLTSVVIFLLLGRSGSLPRCAHVLSGLKEDFLAGCWQTNKKGGHEAALDSIRRIRILLQTKC